MQKIIDRLPDIQSFELNPKFDREGINEKFLELIQYNKQTINEKIKHSNIPKLIPVIFSLVLLITIFENGWDYYDYLGKIPYDIFWNLIIILWFTHLFSSLASLEIKRLWIPVWNYWKCLLRDRDNTIEFHVSGISEVPKEQLIEKITQDVVDLCLQYQVLKECEIDKIELKSYLLQAKSVQKQFLELLSQKLSENNIQIEDWFIQKSEDEDLPLYKKLMLMWKVDWLKNTDRYFKKSPYHLMRILQIKWWFNSLINLLETFLKSIAGWMIYCFPIKDKHKKWKKRIQKTSQLHIDLHKISHKNNS